MTERGRPPKPTALRRLEGNRGHRRMPENEATPKPQLPQPPAIVRERPDALAEWRRVGRQLEQQGLITLLDRAAFTIYCLAWAELVEAERALREEGRIIVREAGMDDAGVWRPERRMLNGNVAVKRFAVEHLFKAIARFGMSPVDRAKVASLATEKAAEDPLDALMARRGGVA